MILCGPYTNIWGDPIIGEHTKIAAYVEVGKDVHIGDYCHIGAYTFIPPGTRIADKVWIGPRVTFCNDKYPPSAGNAWRMVFIERDVIIGANALILPGVTIERGVRVAAGAIITRNISKEITEWVKGKW